MVMYWSFGTFLFTSTLTVLVNTLPFMGPLLGLVLVLAIEPLIML